MPPNSTEHAQITQTLLTKYSLPVSPTWLATTLALPREGPTQTLPLLTQSILTALLQSDITTTLSPSASNTLPANIIDPTIKERRLDGPTQQDIPLQLLSVEDIGRSKWSQVEAIERRERGEEVRGREVVRNIDIDATGNQPAITANNPAARAQGFAAGAGIGAGGPHRYIFQDAKGVKVTAFESGVIKGIGAGDEGCKIGMKVLLKRGCLVRRGVLMLEGSDAVVLGGKVEVWDEAWRRDGKKRLIDAVTGSGT